MVKTWKCICDRKWHLCATHCHYGLRKHREHLLCSTITDDNIEESQSRNSSKVVTKRKVQTLSGYDAILADDLERHTRKSLGSNHGDISLGETVHEIVKPNLLGRILKERFFKRAAEGLSSTAGAKRLRT